MKRTLLIAILTLLPALAGAQVLTLDVDKSTIPGLGFDTILPYELDGNPATREFLQFARDPVTDQLLIRGISTHAGICMSAYYNPFNYARVRGFDFFIFGQILRAGDRDKFVYSGQTSYGEIDLTPRCN